LTQSGHSPTKWSHVKQPLSHAANKLAYNKPVCHRSW